MTQLIKEEGPLFLTQVIWNTSLREHSIGASPETRNKTWADMKILQAKGPGGQQPKQKCREQIWATVVISKGLEARVEGAVETSLGSGPGSWCRA